MRSFNRRANVGPMLANYHWSNVGPSLVLRCKQSMHSKALSIFINLIQQNCYLNLRNTKKEMTVMSNAKYNEHTLSLLKEPNLLN